MPDVIDYTAAMTSATAEATAASAEKTAQLAIAQDPMVTKQALVNEQTDRKLADVDLKKKCIAIAKFIGQNALDDQNTNFTRSPAVALPVANGDSLEEAIAKLLSLVNKHPLPPGTVLPYQPTSAGLIAQVEVKKLDLITVAQSTNSVTTTDGPFWELCDGTGATVNMAGKALMMAGTGVTYATAGGSETIALAASQLPPHKHQIPFFNEPSGDVATPDGGTQLDDGTDPSATYRTGAKIYDRANTLVRDDTTNFGADITLPKPLHVGVVFIRRTARLYYN